MNKKRNHPSHRAGVWAVLTLITALSLLLAACQPAPAPAPTQRVEPTTPPAAPTQPPPPTPTPDYSTQLQNQLWVLVALGDPANPAVVEEGTTVTATFAPDGTVSGSGGCNNYNGGYTLSGDQITVGPLASTMMFCEKGSQQETTYLTALQGAKRLAFSNEGRLQIFYDPGTGVEGVLVYAKGETPLVGTTWVLLSYGSPDQPTTVEPGTTTTALFYDDGSLTGNAGCNTYAAGYTAQDGAMTISMPASTLMACTMGMEQESAYLAALPKAESYAITGPNLEITYDGGAGVLTYTSLALPLEYTMWTLAAFNGTVPAEIVPLTMQFIPGAEPNMGIVGGLVVCNNYNAGYTIDGTNLTISQTATTFMACPPETVETEQAYLATIAGAQTYQILANQMTVTSSEGSLVFVSDRTPLVGTNWILTALGDRLNPVAPAEGADFNAFFTRQPGVPSGLVQGRSGCNEFNSTFVASLSEIKINLPATTMMACPSPIAEQEAEFLQALSSASQYTIISNVLKIPYGEGKMLSFVAEPVQAVPEVDLRPLQGTFWFLTTINGQPIIDGSQITAQFFVNPDAVSGSVSGLAGCNSYNAAINPGFQVSPAATTAMSCSSPAGVMEQEQLYLSQLQSATGYSLAGGQLILPTTSGSLVFAAIPPANQPPVEPSSLLVNRQWYLKAIENTNAVAGSEPTAYFASNGALSGYTGCNNYNGRFTASSDQITITGLSNSQAACPEPQLTQETAFLQGLSQAQRFEVSDTTMRLYTLNNEVLYFTSTPPKPAPPEEQPPVEPPVDPVPPQAIIDAPREAEVNQEVTFNGASSQSAVEIVSSQWDFGDGNMADGESVKHAYANTGDYSVVLTVTDANNLSNATTWVISILPQATPQPPPPPTAVIIAPPSADTVAPVTFDGSASFSDAGIAGYGWDMGNGTVIEGAVVEYIFPTAGNFTVTLTVTDTYGQLGSTTWDIMVYAAMAAPLPEVSQPIATPETTEATPTPTP
jgi:heat shock protein HslJ/PKD repeat protein